MSGDYQKLVQQADREKNERALAFALRAEGINGWRREVPFRGFSGKRREFSPFPSQIWYNERTNRIAESRCYQHPLGSKPVMEAQLMSDYSPAEKPCKTCGEIKPLDQFRKAQSCKDGRRHTCKACHSVKKKRYYEQNRERILAVEKARRERDPEAYRASRREAYRRNPEPAIAYAKKWAKENPQRRKEIASAYVQRNLAEHCRKTREREARNREQVREIKRRSQALRKQRQAENGGEGVTLEEWRAIASSTGGYCTYCGCKGKLAVDHFIPLALGGVATADNLIPACQSCNSRKGAREPVSWITEHFGEEVLERALSLLAKRK